MEASAAAQNAVAGFGAAEQDVAVLDARLERGSIRNLVGRRPRAGGCEGENEPAREAKNQFAEGIGRQNGSSPMKLAADDASSAVSPGLDDYE